MYNIIQRHKIYYTVIVQHGVELAF